MSHLSYSKLEKLNNKILRILQNKSLTSHVIDLYKYYDALPVSFLHLYQILVFVHEFIHHKQNLPDISASYFIENSIIYYHNTRGKSNLHVTLVQSEFGKRLLTHKGSVLLNNLPDDLKSAHNTTEFKESLQHLLYTKTMN